MTYSASFSELYVWGGVPFMTPMTLMIMANICIVIFISFRLIQKKELHGRWLEAIKQIGGLAAAWGTLSTIVGLFAAFDALENSPEVIPFNVIMGGMKVAVITIIYGLLIYCLSMLSYIVLKLASGKNQN